MATSAIRYKVAYLYLRKSIVSVILLAILSCAHKHRESFYTFKRLRNESFSPLNNDLSVLSKGCFDCKILFFR